MKMLGPVVINVPTRKTVKLPNGGFTTKPDGYLVAEIRIAVDEVALANSRGRAAVFNKRKRSVMAGGAIVLEAFNIRKGE